MSTQTVLRLVDAVAEEARRAGSAAPDEGIREQAAFVRALVDEVERHAPEDRRAAALHEQLADELSFLARLTGGGSADELEARLADASRLVRAYRAVAGVAVTSST